MQLTFALEFGKLFLGYELAFVGPVRYRPVSYTHLDVYKRQEPLLAKVPLFEALIVAVVAVVFTMPPVVPFRAALVPKVDVVSVKVLKPLPPYELTVVAALVLPIVLIDAAVATPILLVFASRLLTPFPALAVMLLMPPDPVADIVLDWFAALAEITLRCV